MTRKNPTNTLTYYRQHRDKLESTCRMLNTVQLVCLLLGTIGSGLYGSVKFLHLQVDSQPLAEWLAALASHPLMDILLIAIILAFYFSARCYADAGRFLLARSILEEEESKS
jgi:hypothetical protein